MKKENKKLPQKSASLPQRIKVQLDHKTTMIINKLSSLKIWKKKYPLAKVVN